MEPVLFGRELRLIENPYIRGTAEAIVVAAPAHAAIVPSSSTGKYHPVDEFARGGNVLHARRVVALARHLARARNIVGRDLDVLTGAGVIHDLAQYGWESERSEHSLANHEELLASSTEHLAGLPYYGDLVGTARRHAGNWGPPDEYSSGSTSTNVWLLGDTLHLADYLASRRELMIEVPK